MWTSARFIANQLIKFFSFPKYIIERNETIFIIKSKKMRCNKAET